MAVLEALARHGYIDSAVRKGRGVRRIVDVELKYNDGEPAISGIKYLSKPSRGLHASYRNIKRSRQGYGHYVLSTSKGILTGAEARRGKIGGELLFEIW